MAIYLKLSENPQTLRMLLKTLFSYQDSSGDITNIETYLDKECKKIQCNKNKIRSFDDTLEIAKTYFPETDEKDLMKTLLTLDIKDKRNRQCNLIMMTCEEINRINFVFAPDSRVREDFEDDCELEYKLGSPWSWKDLIGMIGIKTFEQFIEIEQAKE